MEVAPPGAAYQEDQGNAMNSRVIDVSILYGTGIPNSEYLELLSRLDNLKILKEAEDPETFVTQHQGKPPDLALIDLDGSTTIPHWLEPLIDRLPQTEVVVCSHSRDPDFLIRIMKLRAGGFLPLPLNRQEFFAIVERVRAEREKNHAPSLSQILAVTGSKGGVGTTSIATNLGVALAEIMPGEVILVDLARPFPHVGQFLDLDCSHSIKDFLDSADSLDQIFVKKIVQKHKSTLEVLLNHPDYRLESCSIPENGALGKIFTALRASYNWVVVDLGVWPDRFYAQMLQQADQILLVSELTLPDLQNLKIIKALFREIDLDDHKVKVVVNRYTKNYALGLKDLENIFQQPVYYTLPDEHPTLIEAINQGEPLGEVAPRSKLWRRLKELAVELVEQSKPGTEKQLAAKPGLLRRLF